MSLLNTSFYQRNDVVAIARDLLGTVLVSTVANGYRSGVITETEAYHESEKACHAYQGRRTKRTEVLFHAGGQSYVYLCYGIHNLFNVTTGQKNEAAAVLIRAIEPLQGIDEMMLSRKKAQVATNLTAGPGMLTQALGITVKQTDRPFSKRHGVWIEEGAHSITSKDIISRPRIGVDYAEEDALLPWRFYIKGNKWVSKK